MFKNNYVRYFLIILLNIVTITIIVPLSHAKNPVITRYDAHLMEKDVRINLAWQSDEPIVKIIASAGKEQVIFVDNIENERNDRGYSGQIDIVVPAYLHNVVNEQTLNVNNQNPNTFQHRSSETYDNSVSPQQYTVQIVDEVNQRSVLIKDKVRRVEPFKSSGEIKQQPKSTTGMVTVDARDPLTNVLNATIGLVGSIGQTPEVKNVTIKKWTENRISIGFEATGSKGINRVVMEVRDAQGDIAYQNPVYCESEKQCAKQSEPFNLKRGNYIVSLTAVDVENNKSKKIDREIQFLGDN